MTMFVFVFVGPTHMAENLDYCSGGNPHAYNCAGWTTTKVNGLTPQQAWSNWYRGSSGNQNITLDTVDHVSGNPSCPWKLPA